MTVHQERRIQIGFVGGGIGSNIGETHRIAARLDNRYDIVAGAFSSDPERSRLMGIELGIQDSRTYGSWQEMLDIEAARSDRIDVVAIITPSDSHYQICMTALEKGFHVICDKPLAVSLEQATEIAELAEKHDVEFCLTHCFSGYPMVRQARDMVSSGAIGDLQQVHLQCVTGNLSHHRLPDQWRADPSRSGDSLILLDIGTHAYQLGAYVCGQHPTRVFADVGSPIPGRSIDDYASVLFQYERGARGSMWVTNCAAGTEAALVFRVFGAKGGLEWHQEEPNRLTHYRLDGFQEIITRRLGDDVSIGAQRSTRIPIGHPEGYFEAFANLYTEFADRIRARRRGDLNQQPEQLFPGVADGVDSLAFVDAALKSSRQGAWQSVQRTPSIA